MKVMESRNMSNGNYKRFAITMIVSFIVMYSVMFLNVFDTSHIYISTNRFYMSLLMLSPMAIIMLFMIRSMYESKKTNGIIVLSSIVIFILSLTGLRTQAFIGDIEYMKGMIPHHSSAILTSSCANIKNPAVRKLADGIIQSQEKEIDEMKKLLKLIEEKK